jgi:hypothetical protein
MIPRPNVAVASARAPSQNVAPGFHCFGQLAGAFGKHRIRHPVGWPSIALNFASILLALSNIAGSVFGAYKGD